MVAAAVVEHLMPWAAVGISAVAATLAAADTSVAALVLAVEHTLAVVARALVARRASAAGRRYRGMRRGQVSAVSARLRSVAIRAGRPAAQPG